MTNKSRLKHKVIGFCVAMFVGVGFMLVDMKIDIKIISIYDYNPLGISFTSIFLTVGVLLGGMVGVRTFRKLTGGEVEQD